MAKKPLFKILIGIVVLLVLMATVFMANSFLGNPVSAAMAKSKALSYMNHQYKPLDLKIKDVRYNFVSGSYVLSVYSPTSTDTHFLLGYKSGEIVMDDYGSSVLSGMNTMNRFCQEYQKSLLPLVQAKISDVTNIAVIPEKREKYDLEMDSTFDKEKMKSVDLIVWCKGGTDAEYLSDILQRTYDVMKEYGYSAAYFGITGEQEESLTELMKIKPAHIDSGNLVEIMQKSITNTEYDGIMAFRKGEKSSE